jgi:hypothetical protein
MPLAAPLRNHHMLGVQADFACPRDVFNRYRQAPCLVSVPEGTLRLAAARSQILRQMAGKRPALRPARRPLGDWRRVRENCHNA